MSLHSYEVQYRGAECGHQQPYKDWKESPDSYSRGYIDYLKKKNQVLFETEHWCAIKNSVGRMTAFLKHRKQYVSEVTIKQWSELADMLPDDWHAKVKPPGHSTVRRLHVHLVSEI